MKELISAAPVSDRSLPAAGGVGVPGEALTSSQPLTRAERGKSKAKLAGDVIDL